MSTTKRLIVSIVHFLGEQLRTESLSTDAKESLEVAIQCLESAFSVSSSDTYLMVSKGLHEIFEEIAEREPVQESSELNYRDKEESEKLKNEGNELMKQEKFEEALKKYTKAIQLDNKNPVFFSNRAAAFSKLNNHTFALEDCQRAIEIDPSYSKAYGRMGLAYASLNDHVKAKQFYEKAIELDPNNESFKNNLKIAQEKSKEQQSQNSFANIFENLNMESLMSNPAVIDFAQRMIRGDSSQNIFNQMMGSFGQQTDNNSNSDSRQQNSENTSGMPYSNFFRVGDRFFQLLQQSNPEFLDQIRREFNRINENNQGNNNNNNNNDNNQQN